MLIMGQTNRVCAQFFDKHRILIMVFLREGVALVHPVLVTAHAAQRSLDTVDNKALFRVAGEASYAHSCADLVIGFVAALEGRRNRVKIGIINPPPYRVRHIKRHLCIVRRTYCGCNFPSVGILYGIHYRKVLVRVCHP